MALLKRPYLLLLLLAFLGVTSCQYQSDTDYDDYVKEVLEEDYRNDEDYYDNPYDDFDREELLRKKQEAKLAEEERLKAEQAEKEAREREAKFEAELSRMSAEKKKAAKRQKKRDTKIVKQVIKAAKQENHYAVLGLRNWEISINPRSISIGPKQFTIPGFKLFHISPSKIKKAYRNRGKMTHPDKNRDGHANEAFIAVENSASLLSDEKLREEYDKQLRQLHIQQRQKASRIAAEIRDTGVGAIMKTTRLFRSVLGPFALPVFILGALII